MRTITSNRRSPSPPLRLLYHPHHCTGVDPRGPNKDVQNSRFHCQTDPDIEDAIPEEAICTSHAPHWSKTERISLPACDQVQCSAVFRSPAHCAPDTRKWSRRELCDRKSLRRSDSSPTLSSRSRASKLRSYASRRSPRTRLELPSSAPSLLSLYAAGLDETFQEKYGKRLQDRLLGGHARGGPPSRSCRL